MYTIHNINVFQYFFAGSSQQAPTPSDIGIPAPDKNLGYLENEHLLEFANCMGPEWKQVGVRLGLSWKRIQQICSDYSLSQDRIINMLTEWRKQQNYETNQVEIMYRVLTERGLAELANKAFRSQLLSVDQPFLVEGEGHASAKLHLRRKEKDGKCFDDQDLLFICDQLEPGSWRRLGVRLGLKWTDINKIANNNRLVKDRIMELLVTWRDNHSTDQVPIMVNALKQQQLVGLARRVCERHGYRDESEVAATQINATKQRQVHG
ncbi:uncharacterized protein LOC117108840 isoform X2 [Anneissia japonica]|uniref:uncharacterized protein LOC117108840 isoform X2 n=1 Tax=Anneissia japonica TaxID=1529436 RepID=UPI0014256FCE|nr:uncharacterized protein LOC117108840 isoform X2 [Anneissia japonica]